MDAQIIEYQELFAELEQLENSGVPMFMEGSLASPMQIVSAHLLKEEGTYMRDYVMDPKGYIEEITFHDVKEQS